MTPYSKYYLFKLHVSSFLLTIYFEFKFSLYQFPSTHHTIFQSIPENQHTYSTFLLLILITILDPAFAFSFWVLLVFYSYVDNTYALNITFCFPLFLIFFAKMVCVGDISTGADIAVSNDGNLGEFV